MITDLTRRDLIDLFNSYDPEPVTSMFAEMGAGTPRHLLVGPTRRVRVPRRPVRPRSVAIPRPKVRVRRRGHLAAPREQPRLGERLDLPRRPLRARYIRREAALLPR